MPTHLSYTKKFTLKALARSIDSIGRLRMGTAADSFERNQMNAIAQVLINAVTEIKGIREIND